MTHLSRRAFLAGTGALLVTSACRTSRTRAPKPAAAPAAVGRGLDVERFLEDLQAARRGADAHAAVQDVIARAVSDPRSVLLGLGEPERPSFNLLHRADDLTVVNIVWAPYMIIPPHDHRMWAAVGIYTGREDNVLWRHAAGTVEAYGAASLSEEEVFGLADDAIHSVINPIDRLTGAIHVYGGDLPGTVRSRWDPETLEEGPMPGVEKLFREANERYERSLAG